MEELGLSLGLTWTEVVENPGQRLWTPESGQQEVPLKFVYSCEGPQHLEQQQRLSPHERTPGISRCRGAGGFEAD